MSADADIVFEPFQQLRHKQTQGTALLHRACILGTPFRIQTAFIAYPDATGIVPLAMCADKFYRTGIHHLPVTTDLVVVTDASEPATTMYRLQLLHRKATILAGGGTVNNDVVNRSHVIIFNCYPSGSSSMPPSPEPP